MNIQETLIQPYGEIALIFFVSLIVLMLANTLLGKRIKRLEAKQAQVASTIQSARLSTLRFIKRIGLPLVFLAVFAIAIERAEFGTQLEQIVKIIFAIIMTIIIVRSLNKALELTFSKYFEKEYANQGHANNLKPLLSFVKLILWIIGFLILLGNLGFDVTTALAGLGVGGIAVAIAAQGVLGDLFSYFVIFFDHPFTLGDYIVFGDKSGVVERIGIKSSRIRVLNGEVLIVSNSDLTSSRIHNYKQMQRRRVVQSLAITYETPIEKVRKVPQIIKDTILSVTTMGGVVFERSHFQTFGSSALLFETVYYIPSPDYNLYMDVQQEINLKLLEVFKQEEIEFAYPTQKIWAVTAETQMA